MQQITDTILMIRPVAFRLNEQTAVNNYFQETMRIENVEINKKAYEIAKKENPDITFYNSSIEDFDSNGEKFDVVCVSGILIHIDPKNLPGIINKITSLSKKYIFGSENYSENPTEIVYRGHVDKLWKQNFANLF